MKVITQKTFRALHTWTGLLAGMALFIAFYAGAVSVFTHELYSWQRKAEPVTTRQLQDIQPNIEQLLLQHPEAAEGFSLILPGEHGPDLVIQWYDKDNNISYKILPESAVDNITPARQDFVSFIYDLHFTAGLPRTFGLYLFGVFCILYGLALLSGVVIYAPVFLKDLFALRISGSAKRLWQDAHNVVGILSLPFHIIFAWSGAVLTIGFFMLAPFQFTVFDGRLLNIIGPELSVVPHVEPAGVASPMLPVTELLQRAQQVAPQLEMESLFFHDVGDHNGIVTFYGHLPGKTLTTKGLVALNASSGELVKALTPAEYSPGMVFLRGLQSLHYGDFGGYAVKWLYFLLGLAGAFLFYSGNLLWIESRRNATVVQQPLRTRLMAALTLGVCIGCMAGVSALFVAGVLLPEVWHSRCYYLIFFAVLGWAFLRQPAKAAPELLQLTAILTLLIPAAAYWQSGQHLFSALWQGHTIRFGIDVTALIMCWVFWQMATAARKRSRQAGKSVWAVES